MGPEGPCEQLAKRSRVRLEGRSVVECRLVSSSHPFQETRISHVVQPTIALCSLLLLLEFFFFGKSGTHLGQGEKNPF